MLGLILTSLYVLTAYLAPTTIFGSLAEYRIELILAALTFAASIPKLSSSDLLRCVQTYTLPALALAITLSISLNGWLGGGPIALLDFIPNIAVFFFVSINLRTIKQLRVLILVLFFAAAFVISRAAFDIHVGDAFSPYLMADSSSAGGTFYRIRGLALINDPNDLGQFLVALVPCMFFFWRSGKNIRNLLTVVPAVMVLLIGLYLTHSRGAMLALLMVILLASRRKIGTIPAIVIACLLFAGFTAAGWSGGRDISADAGSDRMEAWSVGLELLRAHPLFGIGYRHFQEFYEITAHNTVIVCSAETGVFGYFCWMLFVLPTVRDAIAGSEDNASEKSLVAADSRKKDVLPWEDTDFLDTHSLHESEMGGSTSAEMREARLALADDTETQSLDLPGLYMADDVSNRSESGDNAEEVRRISRIMVLSMAGFLTAGWFLSRAFVLSLFLLGGIVSVVYRLARKQYAEPPLAFRRAAKLSALACAGSLIFMYVLLRVTNFAHR